MTVMNYVLAVFEFIFIGVAIYQLAGIFSSKLDILGLIVGFTGFIRKLFKVKR